MRADHKDVLVKIASASPRSILVVLLVAFALVRTNFHGFFYLALAFIELIFASKSFSVQKLVCIYSVTACCGHIAVTISARVASLSQRSIEALEIVGFHGYPDSSLVYVPEIILCCYSLLIIYAERFALKEDVGPPAGSLDSWVLTILKRSAHFLLVSGVLCAAPLYPCLLTIPYALFLILHCSPIGLTVSTASKPLLFFSSLHLLLIYVWQLQRVSDPFDDEAGMTTTIGLWVMSKAPWNILASLVAVAASFIALLFLRKFGEAKGEIARPLSTQQLATRARIIGYAFVVWGVALPSFLTFPILLSGMFILFSVGGTQPAIRIGWGYSIAVVITQHVFLIMRARDELEEVKDEPLQNILDQIGLTPKTSSISAFRTGIISSPVGWLGLLVCFTITHRKAVFSLHPKIQATVTQILARLNLLLVFIHALPLAVVFFIGLLHFDILHSVFMIFCIGFSVSDRKVVKLLWPLLVVYSAAVIIVLFIGQFPAFNIPDDGVFGFYASAHRQGLWEALAIFTVSEVQWALTFRDSRHKNNAPAAALPTSAVISPPPPTTGGVPPAGPALTVQGTVGSQPSLGGSAARSQKILEKIIACVIIVGLPLTGHLLLLLHSFSLLQPTTVETNILAAIYFILFTIGLTVLPLTSTHKRRYWLACTLYSAAVLILRYVCRFDGVTNRLSEWSLRRSLDLGLISPDSYPQSFLAADTAILVVCAYCLRQKTSTKIGVAQIYFAETQRLFKKLTNGSEGVRLVATYARGLGGVLVTLSLFFAAFTSISVIGITYFFIFVFWLRGQTKISAGRWRAPFAFASSVAVANIIWNIRTFRDARGSRTYDWLGLRAVDAFPADAQATQLIIFTLPHIAVAFASALNHAFSRMEIPTTPKPDESRITIVFEIVFRLYVAVSLQCLLFSFILAASQCAGLLSIIYVILFAVILHRSRPSAHPRTVSPPEESRRWWRGIFIGSAFVLAVRYALSLPDDWPVYETPRKCIGLPWHTWLGFYSDAAGPSSLQFFVVDALVLFLLSQQISLAGEIKPKRFFDISAMIKLVQADMSNEEISALFLSGDGSSSAAGSPAARPVSSSPIPISVSSPPLASPPAPVASLGPPSSAPGNLPANFASLVSRTGLIVPQSPHISPHAIVAPAATNLPQSGSNMPPQISTSQPAHISPLHPHHRRLSKSSRSFNTDLFFQRLLDRQWIFNVVPKVSMAVAFIIVQGQEGKETPTVGGILTIFLLLYLLHRDAPRRVLVRQHIWNIMSWLTLGLLFISSLSCMPATASSSIFWLSLLGWYSTDNYRVAEEINLISPIVKLPPATIVILCISILSLDLVQSEISVKAALIDQRSHLGRKSRGKEYLKRQKERNDRGLQQLLSQQERRKLHLDYLRNSTVDFHRPYFPMDDLAAVGGGKKFRYRLSLIKKLAEEDVDDDLSDFENSEIRERGGEAPPPQARRESIIEIQKNTPTKHASSRKEKSKPFIFHVAKIWRGILEWAIREIEPNINDVQFPPSEWPWVRMEGHTDASPTSTNLRPISAISANISQTAAAANIPLVVSAAIPIVDSASVFPLQDVAVSSAVSNLIIHEAAAVISATDSIAAGVGLLSGSSIGDSAGGAGANPNSDRSQPAVTHNDIAGLERSAEVRLVRSEYKISDLGSAILYLSLSHTTFVVAFVAIVAHAARPSPLFAVIPIVIFSVGLVWWPVAPRRFWLYLVNYIEFLLAVKLLSFFILRAISATPSVTQGAVSWMNVGVAGEFLTLLALFLHRDSLKSLGIWRDRQKAETEMMADPVSALRRLKSQHLQPKSPQMQPVISPQMQPVISPPVRSPQIQSTPSPHLQPTSARGASNLRLYGGFDDDEFCDEFVSRGDGIVVARGGGKNETGDHAGPTDEDDSDFFCAADTSILNLPPIQFNHAFATSDYASSKESEGEVEGAGAENIGDHEVVWANSDSSSPHHHEDDFDLNSTDYVSAALPIRDHLTASSTGGSSNDDSDDSNMGAQLQRFPSEMLGIPALRMKFPSASTPAAATSTPLVPAISTATVKRPSGPGVNLPLNVTLLAARARIRRRTLIMGGKLKTGKRVKKEKRKKKEISFERVVEKLQGVGRELRGWAENRQAGAGSDSYYTVAVAAELACLLLLLAGIVQSSSNTVNSLNASSGVQMLTVKFVLLSCAQFILIVLDRVSYVRQNLSLKFFLHVSSIILWFSVVVFNMLADGASYAWAVIFSLGKSVYWVASASQIRRGFPRFGSRSHFLTHSYTSARYLVYLVYRAAPFVYEMQSLLDWACTPTTLSLNEWLKMEAIFSGLFERKVELVSLEEEKRVLGQRQKLSSKILTGACMFVVLCLIVWGPLLIASLSSALAEPQPLPILSASLSLSLDIYTPDTPAPFSYPLLSSQARLTRAACGDTDLIFNGFSNIDWDIPTLSSEVSSACGAHPSVTVQVLQFRPESFLSWGISPPNRDEIVRGLNDTHNTIHISLSLSLSRNASLSSDASILVPTVEILSSVSLFAAQRAGLIHTVTDETAQVFVPGGYDATLRLGPVVSSSLSPAGENVKGMTIVHRSRGAAEWFDLCMGNVGFSDECRGLQIVCVSDPLYLGFFSALGLSLTTVYATFVLFVANLVRGFITGLVQKITFEDFPNVDLLMSLWKTIYAARHADEFNLEELLYRDLISIYRSPETLIQLTRAKKKKD